MPIEELGPFGEFLTTYGAWAMMMLLFASGFGIPIGEEVVNVPAGILVGKGYLPPIPVYIAAYVGVLGGDFLWFSICRFFGKGLLSRKWFRRFIHPRRLLEAKHQFDKTSGGMLILARFIPGSRSPALTIAALMRMGWKRFIAIELICCIIATPIQVTLGILIGREMADASLKTTIFTGLAVVASIIALTAIINWWRMRKKDGPSPRARIRWLRGGHANSRAKVHKKHVG